ncbi:MAG: oligosaccharide flippase family protein [Bacteroidales bacterium]|nr:oligosaccharide flippase family protein [Bacteroidales bacterium]
MRSDFFRNVATLMTGSTVAQLIALAIYPILTDLYEPEDFGLFSLYMGIIAITGILSTGRYHLAILMPSDDKNALNVASVAFVISVMVGLFLLSIVALFRKPIAAVFNNPGIEQWLWLVPLSTFLIAFFQISIYWHNRRMSFRNTAAGNLVQSITNSAVKLSTSGTLPSGGGLISGAIAGQLAGSGFFFYRWIVKFRHYFKNISWVSMKEVSRTYYRFPGFNMPNNLVNNISNSLPVFLISAYFGAAELGFYSLGFTMIFSPMNLVTNSMEQVFSQRLIAKYNNGVTIWKDFSTLLKRSFQLGFIPFLLAGIFGPFLFRIIFGAEWEVSGNYMRLLMPWFFTAFMANQLTFIPDLFSRQKTAFLLNVIRLLLRIAGLAIGIYYQDIMLALGLFSLSSLTIVIVTLIWYIRLVKRFEGELVNSGEE